MKKRKASVRWRLVLVYFVLVFVAMSIISVFLLNRIEKYQLSSLQENIDGSVNESGLMDALCAYDDLNENKADIQQYISRGFSYLSEEITVVDRDMNIIASTNTILAGRNAAEVFDAGIIASVLEGGDVNSTESQNADGIAVLSLCYPIQTDKNSVAKGVVYVRSDISSIQTLTSESRNIFIKATLIALLITAVLGFFLATNITEPINSLTKTVEKMSNGDFSAEVPIRSNDEIGQLATMFNLMQGKLDETLGEIESEKRKLEAILRYMADGLIAITKDGEIVHINTAAQRMLGLGKDFDEENADYDSLLGHLSEDLELATVLDNSASGETECIINHNGFTLAIRYDRFASDDASSAGILILLQDITERQKLETMQKDFVANVSHELKTPLATVRAYSETLMDGGVDPETTDIFLETINHEAARMARLVMDLLQLSRLDHQEEKYIMREENLAKLLVSCASAIGPMAKEKNQSVTVLFDKDAQFRVNIDKDKMEQVILNILSNSVKYTQEGGAITIDAKKEDSEVVFTIKDNGVGISEEDQKRMFERFYRVDKARSRAMGSSGLGLAITKNIVEKHQGDISVKSKPGEGTAMSVRLPLVTHRGIANID